MKFKNKLFEQNLCQAFDCNKRSLSEHLPNVEQAEINGSFQDTPLTLFVRDKNSLIRPVKVHADFDGADLADLGMFSNLRGMKAACRRNLRKLFVHSWPVGVSSIVWQDIGDASEELIANLDRFEALSQLTLYGTSDTVWPEFSAEVKSRLKQFSVKHFDCKHLEGFNSLVKLNLTLLAEAFDDAVTGFLDMLDIPYSGGWLLSERLTQLNKFVELPQSIQKLNYAEFDRIIGENSTFKRWLLFREMHKELIYFAAGFCKNNKKEGRGGGSLVTTVLHLLQRFPDSEIEHALTTPSAVSHLAPLCYLSKHEKGRVRYILRKRAEIHTKKIKDYFLT